MSAEDDGSAVGKPWAGVWREHDKAMVGGMERLLCKGLIRIVVAAAPSIDVELAEVAAAAAAAVDNTDHIRILAGHCNPRRYTGSRRIALRIKGLGRGKGGKMDGVVWRREKMVRLRALNKEKCRNVGGKSLPF